MKELKDGQPLINEAKKGNLTGVTTLLQSGDNFDVLDVEDAILEAIKLGSVQIITEIMKAYPHNFIAGYVLNDAVESNNLQIINLLLSYNPEWHNCARANAKAKELGYNNISDAIKPFIKIPQGLQK